MDRHQQTHAGGYFRAQDDAEQRALKDAVSRIPGGVESRQLSLERGHDAVTEVSDDEDAPDAKGEMWPAQRRAVQEEPNSDDE
eukprot:6822297-Alexandrium_andersonii.AAC.1